MKILDCKNLRDVIEENVKEEIDFYSLNRKKPSLCVIMVGNDPASEAYVKNKKKACERVGIEFKTKRFEPDIPQEYLLDAIYSANITYDGVMVQLPLPHTIVDYDVDKILSRISPQKDVDGLTLANKMKLYTNNSAFVPCTARGVLTLLDYSVVPERNGDYSCLSFCIIGRSDLVGKPLAHEIEGRNGTVTLCHSHTSNEQISYAIETSDIVISATGHQIDTSLLSTSPIAYIDCGYSFKDGKACGDIDIDFLDHMGYNGMVTKTPSGTGLLTVSSLLENVVESWESDFVNG